MSIPVKIVLNGMTGTLNVGGAYNIHTTLSALSSPLGEGPFSPGMMIKLKTKDGVPLDFLLVREPLLAPIGFVCEQCTGIANGMLQNMMFVREPSQKSDRSAN